jgi:hypothetical protein
MNMDWTRKAVFPLLLLLAVVIGPRPASAADARLYELLENMSIVQEDGRTYREAWAALDGTARPGTLLCPLQVACEIHGWGWSRVDIATGQGTVSGYFAVVVDGDNAVDGPEAVLQWGRFSGTMDFSPAFRTDRPLPYGRVVGKVTVGNNKTSQESPFTGTFYLPFVFPGDSYNTPFYLSFTDPSGVVQVGDEEKALKRPTVKFEICLGPGSC